MNETTLKSFPSTKSEALALIYVKSQDLTNVTPEQLYAMYKDALERIRKASGANWQLRE